MPRQADTSVAVLQAPLAAALPRPHAWQLGRGGEGAGAGQWDGAEGCCAWAFRERRLGPPPASCQPDAARAVLDPGTEACCGFLGAAFFAGAVVIIVVAAAGAARAAGSWAGAGSLRDSASSRRSVLMTPSRDAIWRCSKAIIACSAVGGGGGLMCGPAAPFSPLGAGAVAPPPCRCSRAEFPQGKEPAPRLWP